MKNILKRLPLLFSAVVLPLSHVSGEDELSTKVRVFTQRVSEAGEAKSTPDGSKVGPSESGSAMLQSMRQEAIQQERLRWVAQLKKLQALISQGDDEQAERMLTDGVFSQVMPEFQQEWVELSGSLSTELHKRMLHRTEEWSGKVNQLVKDTREAFRTAKGSDELDPLLVRCAALQMPRFGHDNIVTERTMQKLAGVASILRAGSNFLDQRDAGNVKAANDILRNLINSPSQFPVIPSTEIQAMFCKEDSSNEPDLNSIVAQIFAGIKTPDDISTALAKLENLASKSKDSGSQRFFQEKRPLEALKNAWESTKKGDDIGALQALNRSSASFPDPSTQADFDRIRNQIKMPIITGKISKMGGGAPLTDESIVAFITREMDAFVAKADYTSLADVMSLCESVDRIDTASLTRDRTVIEKFLAGQRYEAVGDAPSAVTCFREVVAWPTGKYVPTQLAQEALQRLKAKYPDVFKDFEGVVLIELRALHQQLQQPQMFRGAPGIRP